MLLACCSLLEVPQARLTIAAAGTIASLFGGFQSVTLHLADREMHRGHRIASWECVKSEQRPANAETAPSLFAGHTVTLDCPLSDHYHTIVVQEMKVRVDCPCPATWSPMCLSSAWCWLTVIWLPALPLLDHSTHWGDWQQVPTLLDQYG